MSEPNAQLSDPPEAPESAFDVAYPEALRREERRLLQVRQGDAKTPISPSRLVGFGLSGGGIRSATFALGLFQGMARKPGLLRQIDFLSTVSGGGYFGSFFGRLLTREYVKTADDVEKVLLGEKKPEVVSYLRENGRYMSPNGAGDSLLFGAALLRNWVSVHLVLSLFGLALFLGLQLLRVGLEVLLEGDNRFLPPLPANDALIWWSPLIWLPLVTFVFIAFPIGWAYWLAEPESGAIKEGAGEKDASTSREVSAIPPVAGLALVCVVSLWLAVSMRDQGNIAAFWGSLAAVTLLTFGVWKLAQHKLPDERPMKKEPDRGEKMDQALYRNRALRNRLGLWLTTALVVTALLLILALVDSLGQSLYAVLTGDNSVQTWLTALLSSFGVLVAFSRWIALFFSKRSGAKGDRPSLPLKLIASVAALLLVLFVLVALDLASHAIAWGGDRPKGAPARLLEEAKGESAYHVEVKGSSTPVDMDLRVRNGKDDDAEEAQTDSKNGERDLLLTLVGFASTLLLSILFGQTWPFVNRSTHQPIYGARLTRAYLGASNEKRWGGTNVTETVEGDDFDLARYWPPPAKNGAPIHLINVTINETIDGQSQVQQQDRKGLGLALGPWGLSAGVKHHLVLPLGDEKKMLSPEDKPVFAIYPTAPSFRVFDYKTEEGEGQPRFTGEMLPLGTWVSISGAAFSTGVGMRTSLGLSLLTGFGNVRLGCWWDSGVVRDKKEQPPAPDRPKKTRRKLGLRIEDTLARLFPVQVYMLDEFLARFPGTSRRHWYLSDGGHFENMGGYELLRRRLPFIVIVDGEQDADYTFGGLSNLVRKARIDFDAEVFFLTEEDLDEVLDESVRPYIGALEQLRRGTWEDTDSSLKKPHGRLKEANLTGSSLAHAALARVKYHSHEPGEPAESWLLYIKPTLTGREPVDLVEYHRAHPSFPHEPTIDQFFDEAQWESYRRLGEYIAEVLFGKLDQLLPEDARTPNRNLLKKKEDQIKSAVKNDVKSYS